MLKYWGKVLGGAFIYGLVAMLVSMTFLGFGDFFELLRGKAFSKPFPVEARFQHHSDLTWFSDDRKKEKVDQLTTLGFKSIGTIADKEHEIQLHGFWNDDHQVLAQWTQHGPDLFNFMLLTVYQDNSYVAVCSDHYDSISFPFITEYVEPGPVQLQLDELLRRRTAEGIRTVQREDYIAFAEQMHRQEAIYVYQRNGISHEEAMVALLREDPDASADEAEKIHILTRERLIYSLDQYALKHLCERVGKEIFRGDVVFLYQTLTESQKRSRITKIARNLNKGGWISGSIVGEISGLDVSGIEIEPLVKGINEHLNDDGLVQLLDYPVPVYVIRF